jgi:predicted nuclease of predicted toxin-antitoxin system
MRLLLDNNLSVRLVDHLKPAGWDVVHIRVLGLQAAKDPAVLDLARMQERILVSADTDFGTLLARSHALTPSVVLVRRLIDRRAEDLAQILVSNLPIVEEDLRAGSVVTIAEDSVRVRRLPIG